MSEPEFAEVNSVPEIIEVLLQRQLIMVDGDHFNLTFLVTLLEKFALKDLAREVRKRSQTLLHDGGDEIGETDDREPLVVDRQRERNVTMGPVIATSIVIGLSAGLGFWAYYQHKASQHTPTVRQCLAKNGTCFDCSRESWAAQEPDVPGRLLPDKNIKYVLMAHTVTPGCLRFDACAALMRSMQKYNMHEKRLEDIPYNFVIGGDLRVYEGRGYNNQSAVIVALNQKSYTIAYMGDYEGGPQPKPGVLEAMRDRTLEFIECSINQGKIPPSYQVFAVCEEKDSLSPGKYVYADMRSGLWPNRGTPDRNATCTIL